MSETEIAVREEERRLADTATIDELRLLHRRLDETQALILSQNAMLEQLNRALGALRVTRAQEKQLLTAIRERADEIASQERMTEAQHKALASSIRTSIREMSGVRAIGDIPATAYDSAMEAVRGWYMYGVIRKIRRTNHA